MIESLSAIAAARLGPLAETTPTTSTVKPGDFASALAEGANNMADQIAQADKTSMAALSGQAGPREVAETVMTAEQSLQTAIAVRDKLVNAFLDISRMQI
ncbi:flagellar hook-basal body complex protein FliE [Notoacmeibacter ruber]|uniref:Flagellar hook-basal body complex protein FliE n=1 Tax=Notoacmeibacter ruber TaxID=2670375 RepID=A0A3L7JK12_9HYPH|nr:flagellar hook-basal body complex protein FliE [Notoacmeibacter ruber]RLQ88822.1 flagellar hook-basal body complex protein FliE [Notoacmeibacter ruber]